MKGLRESSGPRIAATRARPAGRKAQTRSGFPSGFSVLSDSGRGEIRRLLLREKAQIPLMKNQASERCAAPAGFSLDSKIIPFPAPKVKAQRIYLHVCAAFFTVFGLVLQCGTEI